MRRGSVQSFEITIVYHIRLFTHLRNRPKWYGVFSLSFFWFSFWWSSNDVIAMMSVFRILHCSRLLTRLHWRGISVLNIQNWQILMSMIWMVNQCSARKLFSRDPALLTQVEFDWHFITGCTSFKLETVLGRFSIR